MDPNDGLIAGPPPPLASAKSSNSDHIISSASSGREEYVSHRSNLQQTAAVPTKEPWPTSASSSSSSSRYHRRRKDEELSGSGSTRLSNSSTGGAPVHSSKMSTASPNFQPSMQRGSEAAILIGSASATAAPNSASSLTGNRAQPLTHFDLEASAFPPLPALDQVAANNASASYANVSFSKAVSTATSAGISAESSGLHDMSTMVKAVSAVPATVAWGENRLADVVKGTAKTKSNKTVAADSDNRSNSASPPPTQKHTTLPTQQTQGNQKTNEHSQQNVISSVKTLQNSEVSNAQQCPQLATVILPILKAACELSLSSVVMTPPFSPADPHHTSIASTTAAVAANSPLSSCSATNQNLKNKPVIKFLTADKSTKTDESLLNGLDVVGRSGITTDANAMLNAVSGGDSVAAALPVTTTNAATMTSIESPIAVYSSATKAPAVASTATMTVPVTKAGVSQNHHHYHGQHNKTTTKQSYSSSAGSSASPTTNATTPNTPIPATASAVLAASLASGTQSHASTPAAAAVSDSSSAATRLSYAQVAQHHKERLNKDQKPDASIATTAANTLQSSDRANVAPPTVVVVTTPTAAASTAAIVVLSATGGTAAEKITSDKHSEKENKRKDSSPNSRVLLQSSHAGDVKSDRAGKT